ncbi:hypothetical protein NGM10_02610 [Halorussus salilacus]|uniref:hypothetical protein n=1 Tax=Halorussus salilacus TaxID=2953750 RepID=UPI0020A04FAE|nr:hypothetical protein [Halorussus salilacus]USZ68643.1 hypothetical protein NGM10_02610 [Halorussus salilacus]
MGSNLKFVCFLIPVLILGMATVSGSAVAQDETVNETVISGEGIVYQISFSKANSSISTTVVNPTDWEDKITGYILKVDGQRVHDANFRLDQDEQQTEQINITPGINVNQREHTITFSTYENTTRFNFTREIDSTDSETVPAPHISNVEVKDGTAKGEPSAVANVTIVNPSKQLYSTKLMVHTVDTDGSLYPASVRPGDSRTISVELLDEQGSEIAGEARLYTGNMTTEEGALDQVEFAGQDGGDTSVRDASYEPARPTWMSDNYEYENESYERGIGEKLSRGHDVEGIPVVYPAVAFLVGVGMLRKWR